MFAMSMENRKKRSAVFYIGILFLGLLALFSFSNNKAFGKTITLAWDASDGAVGYNLYSGNTAGVYPWVQKLGNVTTYTTGELTDGYTYYFAAKAVDSAGNESDYSNVISYTVIPSSYTISASAGTGGAINPSGNTTVTSGGSQTYTITPGPGYVISSVSVNGTSVGAVSSYTFSNVTSNKTIAASFTPLMYAISTSAGAGGTISPSSATITHGGNQLFTITPNTGYAVSSVTVDGVNQGAISSYTFSNVTANHAISATFSANTYSITASAGTGGTITASAAVSYGSSKTFTITPNTGYAVSSVTVDGVNQGAITSYTFNNVTANHTISATFSANTYSITASAGTGGTITASSSVTYGGSKTFTITPNAGYAVSSVTVDGVSQGGITSYTFSNVTANHTISATFSANTYSITASAGTGGTITASAAVSYGSNKTFTITPNTGYAISSVLVDGVSIGAVASYTFSNVTANHTISAVFTANTYTITSSAGTGGTITASATVAYGTSKTFTITPNTGYAVSSVTVDGVNQGAITSYTFNNVTANHTISATFSANTYSITASAGTGGTITASAAVSYGSSKTFTITPNTGYVISSVTVDGANQGAISSYTFSNVTANHTISAVFSPFNYTITVTQTANGTISPSTVSVAHGTSRTFTITPNTGYNVGSVSVNGLPVGAVSLYTFSNVTANQTITATFVSKTYYTVKASAETGGSISPSGDVGVESGSSKTFSISSGATHKIGTVHVNGVSVGAVSSYTFKNVTSNQTITATFVPKVFYTISASAGKGGMISPSGITSVESGTGYTYTISPGKGYAVSDVLVNGISVGPVPSYTFTNITANQTIVATFIAGNPGKSRIRILPVANTYTITVSAGMGGTISPLSTVMVSSGDDKTFNIRPMAGYRVESVYVNGASVGAVKSYTFYDVTTNQTLEATFTPDLGKITVVRLK